MAVEDVSLMWSESVDLDDATYLNNYVSWSVISSDDKRPPCTADACG